MDIESIHKYIALNKMANGTTEVLFAGQPCLTVSEGLMGTVWKINPVFAKLVYGANVFEDIPPCTSPFASIEEAIAGGLVKLHELGAFSTAYDFPEDTYAATMKQVSEEVMAYAQKNTLNVFEAHHKFNQIMESIHTDTFDTSATYKAPILENKSIEISKKNTHSIFDTWKEIKINEGFNQDDYYLVDTTKKKVIRNLGKQRINSAYHGNPSQSPELSQYVKHQDHSVMTGMKLSHLGYTNEARSEYSANMGLSDALAGGAQPTTKKKVWLKDSDGKRIGQGHDHESDALKTWKALPNNKGVKIMREDVDVTDQLITEDADAEYDKWESDVRKTHPSKKLQFKGRVEKGVHTTSAEESGKDRSYGVWDHDKNKGHVFSLDESESSETKEVESAIKKDKKFISKADKTTGCDKDSK
jgi:hypothetical protein